MNTETLEQMLLERARAHAMLTGATQMCTFAERQKDQCAEHLSRQLINLAEAASDPATLAQLTDYVLADIIRDNPAQHILVHGLLGPVLSEQVHLNNAGHPTLLEFRDVNGFRIKDVDETLTLCRKVMTALNQLTRGIQHTDQRIRLNPDKLRAGILLTSDGWYIFDHATNKPLAEAQSLTEALRALDNLSPEAINR